jgi:hypothetical protein
MAHISCLPNKLHPTGIQLDSIKVSSVGHRGAALAVFLADAADASREDCTARQRGLNAVVAAFLLPLLQLLFLLHVPY